MAQITRKKLSEHRQELAKINPLVTWVKDDVNASLQAIIDLLQKASTRSAINSAIETAASGKFTVSQKQTLFSIAVSELFDQEK